MTKDEALVNLDLAIANREAIKKVLADALKEHDKKVHEARMIFIKASEKLSK